MTTFAPTTLDPSRLYQTFITEVATGGLRPGERVGEVSLAARWKAGRVPVRETLLRLEQDGLVVRRGKSGTYVRETNDEQVLEIYDIRAAIEPLIAARAAAVVTAEQAQELSKLAAAADRHEGSGFEREARDRAFHRFLGEVSGMQQAPGIVRVLRRQMRCATVSRFLALLGEYTISYPEHAPIAQAVAARDAQQAGQLMREHLVNAKQAIVTDMQRMRAHLAAARQWATSPAPLDD